MANPGKDQPAKKPAVNIQRNGLTFRELKGQQMVVKAASLRELLQNHMLPEINKTLSVPLIYCFFGAPDQGLQRVRVAWLRFRAS